jgi:HK97 family phage portal protein
VVTSQCLNGAGYLQVVKKSDSSWTLDALNPDSVQVVKPGGGVVRLEYRVDGLPMERLPAKSVDQKILRPYLLPIPYLVTPEHPEGTSPVRDAWQAISGYLKVEAQAATLLDSGTYSGGRLETDHEITADAARRYRETWVDNRRSGQLPVLGNGIRYVNDAIDPVKAQFLETRLANAQAIASMFGVPPDMLGMTMAGGASSLSYANAQDNNRRFRANCLEAFTSQIEDAMSLLLGPGRTYAESRNFIFDWTSWEGTANADTADPTGPVADPAG